MQASWALFGVLAFVALQASATDCGLGAYGYGAANLGCGCPKTTCCTTYPGSLCGCPKTTCCSTYPSSIPAPSCCGCCQLPKTTCCTTIPSCGSGLNSPCNLPCNLPASYGFSSCCGLPQCGCPLPKTTTCTTIPFCNPICGKTTTCTTYPNPCGKSTTTCTTVPHANPSCSKTTTCQTLPYDPCSCCCGAPAYAKTCCTSLPLIKSCGGCGSCGNPLCQCGYCSCPSPCQCGLY